MPLAQVGRVCRLRHGSRVQLRLLRSNIAVSLKNTRVDGGDSVLDYLPPHPAHGTKRHRCVFVVLEQPDRGAARVDLSGFELRDRTMPCTVAEFAERFGMTFAGANFFRTTWDESVDEIYR